MNKTTSYIVAVLACIGIVIIYAVIGALLGWKHGGGILPMIILFGAITATWKGIIGLSKGKNPDDKVEDVEEENNNAT
jgi:uncharacterized membrane protein YeiH